MNIPDGIWLREERQRRGWSAADVAQVAREQAAAAGFPISLTQQAVSAFENGKLKTVPGWVRWVRQAMGVELQPPSGASSAPPLQLVTMQVALPSEAALARMFEGLLRPVDHRSLSPAELARTLAQRLPIGLAQLQDLMPVHGQGEAPADDRDPRAGAIDDLGSQPAPHT